MKRRFEILDVFTDRPLAGNQLGVVHDSEGLSDEAMQAIAREFNFSETIFLSESSNPACSAKVRIFTPIHELPFAGHPTVGAAIVAARGCGGVADTGQGIVVLEEAIGLVRCGVRMDGEVWYAEFDLPALAKPSGVAPQRDSVAMALGLDPAEIGFENHEPSLFNGGLDYALVPVRDLAAAAKAQPASLDLWRAAFGTGSHNCAYVYCRETVGHDNQFHARMFGPDVNIPEDPATGSAVASFAGAVCAFDEPVDGWHVVRIEQGLEMGRPSLITLEIEVEEGVLVSGRIGGHAVVFAHGEIDA